MTDVPTKEPEKSGEEEPVVAKEEAPKGTNGKQQRKRDETPVEELFDLSKPIPRVERPNKVQYEAELAEITGAVDAIKEERRVLQEAIDKMLESNRGSEVGKLREAATQLRAQKGALIDEKKALRAQVDATRSQADKIVKDKKDAKSNVRFSSIEQIDAELAKLQRRQETTSMSLTEEKRLIKEMDSLQSSKKFVADLKSKDTDLDDVKEKRKIIAAQITAKDKEIDAVSKEIDEKFTVIKKLSEKETDKRDNLKGLFNQRDDLRKKMNAKLKEKDTIRDDFREKNNAWYNYQRGIRAQKTMEYEAEKKKREEEKAAWLKMKEEEELKKTPYEEEMALCDYLADYLTRTYLAKDEGKTSSGSSIGIVAVRDDPFAGFKPVVKKDDNEYFGKGKGKKKRVRNKGKSAAGPFTLNVDTFEQFGLLNLSPPTSLEGVAKSVEELRAKKKWFSEQPRGSVRTATDIRKANQKAAAKRRTNGEGSPSTTASQKRSETAFSLSTVDFVPLGSGATSSSVNQNWGQKADAPAPVSADDDSL